MKKFEDLMSVKNEIENITAEEAKEKLNDPNVQFIDVRDKESFDKETIGNAMIVSVAIYIVVSFFLIASFGNTGLWLSLCLFFIARALTLFVYMPRIYQRVA